MVDVESNYRILVREVSVTFRGVSDDQIVDYCIQSDNRNAYTVEPFIVFGD